MNRAAPDNKIDVDENTARLIMEFIEYRDNGLLIEAAQTCEKLIKIMPNSAVVWFDYGRVMRLIGFTDMAVDCFRNSAALDPDMFMSIIFLGHIILEKCQWYDIWEKAGFRRPPWSIKDFCDNPEILQSADTMLLITELYNLGIDLGHAGYFREAAACYKIVTKHCPELVHAHYGLASMFLALGYYSQALPSLRNWNELSRKNFEKPYWYGETIADKTLYIYADHGLGDIVQFVRYLPIAAARCRKVLLYLPPSLWKIVGEIPGVEFIAEIKQPFDAMCSLFMLPHVVGIDEAALSGMVPYLRVDPALIAHWGRLLPKEGVRIGIAWQGNPSSLFDQGRSIPLACYAPLARIPGVTLVSLQLNFGLDQLETLPEGMKVTTLGPDFNTGPDNVVDTAAVMKNIDLIISTDTSVPHIAGALGCPVWVLLKSAPDWRWQVEREDCPWYPTMRLFRQKAAGEWEEVISRVVEALVEWRASRSDLSRISG